VKDPLKVLRGWEKRDFREKGGRRLGAPEFDWGSTNARRLKFKESIGEEGRG